MLSTRSFHCARRVSVALLVCSYAPALAAQSPAAATAAPRITTAALVQSVDSLVRTAIAAGVTPGLGVALVRDGRVVLRRGYGMADATRGVRATDSTRWYVASTSKSFTGFAMTLLAAKGALPFSTPVRTALPAVQWAPGVDPDALTIARLLSHTHQLNDHVITVASAFTGAVPETQWPSLVASVPPAARTALIYSNVGYNLAGMILDTRSRGGWRRVLDSAVFAPAGMRHTTARVSAVPRVLIALPHAYADTGFVTLPFDKRDVTMHAAGGHLATLDDLARWTIVQSDTGVLDGRVVFPAAVVRLAHTMIAPHTEPNGRRFAYFDRDGWGAGWDIGRYDGTPMVSRFGGYATMRSHLSFLPSRRMGVVAMANGGLGPSLTDIVATYTYDLDAGHPDAHTRAWERLEALRARLPESRRTARSADSLAILQAASAPAQPLHTLVGRYTAPAYGTLELSARGTALAYTWGVLSGAVRTVDAAAGTFRFEGGGTDFTLRFEWAEPSGNAHATAIMVNGARLALDAGPPRR